MKSNKTIIIVVLVILISIACLVVWTMVKNVEMIKETDLQIQKAEPQEKAQLQAQEKARLQRAQAAVQFQKAREAQEKARLQAQEKARLQRAQEEAQFQKAREAQEKARLQKAQEEESRRKAQIQEAQERARRIAQCIQSHSVIIGMTKQEAMLALPEGYQGNSWKFVSRSASGETWHYGWKVISPGRMTLEGRVIVHARSEFRVKYILDFDNQGILREWSESGE